MFCQTLTNCSSIGDDYQANIDAFHKRLKSLYPCVDDVTKLPHAWSSDTMASPLGLSDNNLGCYFRGSGRREEDEKIAAAVRTDNYIPPSCLIYYFEIKFKSKGREGQMGVGLTSAQVMLTKLPGWVRESYGYHADDGNTFNGDGRGHNYGPLFTTGDVIGCGYNLVEGKCFFTKNGLNLGKAFDDIPSNILFYPTIGLKTPGEEIIANFGQEDFVYDIEQDLRSLRKDMTLTISNYPIVDFSTWQDTLHKLVQSWLVQNSYPGTAEAFAKLTKVECKENTKRIQERNKIQQLVLRGKISEAIRLTNCLCPSLLQENPNLLFALKCRQFIELISGADSEYQPDFDMVSEQKGGPAKQKLGRILQLSYELRDHLEQLEKVNNGKNETNEKMLHDTVNLMAFTNPSDSDNGKLLDPSGRESISQLLNSSIVKAEQGSTYRAPLEDVVNHLQRLIRLNDSHGKWLIDDLY